MECIYVLIRCNTLRQSRTLVTILKCSHCLKGALFWYCNLIVNVLSIVDEQKRKNVFKLKYVTHQ